MAALMLLTDKNLTSNFKQFLLGNGVLTAAAGFTIGIASAHFVRGIVEDVVFPMLYQTVVFIYTSIVGHARHINIIGKFFKYKHEYRIGKFFQEFVTWILIVVLAFIVLDSVRKALIKVVPESEPDTRARQEE